MARKITRRRFLAGSAMGAVAAVAAGCGVKPAPAPAPQNTTNNNSVVWLDGPTINIPTVQMTTTMQTVGKWSPYQVYRAMDVVEHDGHLYISNWQPVESSADWSWTSDTPPDESSEFLKIGASHGN